MFRRNVLLMDLVEYLNKKYEFNLSYDCMRVKLVEDLEIYGDDIDEFLGALIHDFDIDVVNVDLTGFNVGSEPFDLFSKVAALFKKKNVRQAITIEDILIFINTGNLKANIQQNIKTM